MTPNYAAESDDGIIQRAIQQATRPLQAENARLQAACAAKDAALKRIRDIKWGWDGDGGSASIADDAIDNSGQPLLDELARMREELAAATKCPACVNGISGADYFGESVECGICDHGKITPALFAEHGHERLRLLGDSQADAFRLEELLKELEAAKKREEKRIAMMRAVFDMGRTFGQAIQTCFDGRDVSRLFWSDHWPEWAKRAGRLYIERSRTLPTFVPVDEAARLAIACLMDAAESEADRD